MTKGTEEASRQNHLFVVSKQVCSELGEEEGPDHNSSSLHSDADLTRAGRLRFDKSEQAASFPQRCKSKLVGQVAATGINGSLSASTLGALSLFDIYQQDPSAQGSLTCLWILDYFIILSLDGTYNTCLVHTVFKEKYRSIWTRPRNFSLYKRYQSVSVKPLIIRLITQRDNMKVNQMINMANTDLFSPLAIVKSPTSW